MVLLVVFDGPDNSLIVACCIFRFFLFGFCPDLCSTRVEIFRASLIISWRLDEALLSFACFLFLDFLALKGKGRSREERRKERKRKEREKNKKKIRKEREQSRVTCLKQRNDSNLSLFVLAQCRVSVHCIRQCQRSPWKSFLFFFGQIVYSWSGT